MNNLEISNNSDLGVGFDQGLEQVMSRLANTTAERKRAKELYDKQRAAAYDTFDESADHIAPREVDFHLITRSALHDSALCLLSDRLAELATVVYSDNDETTASKLRSANRRLNEAEQTIKDLRNRVRFLEGRVVTLGRWQDRAGAAAGGAGAASAGGSGGGGDGGAAAIAPAPSAGRKLRPLKKRKARGGEAVDVSVGDGGAGGAAVEELGQVESMLAEVMKKVGDFRIASGLDDVVESQEELVGVEDMEMDPGTEDKGIVESQEEPIGAGDMEMDPGTKDKGKEVARPE